MSREAALRDHVRSLEVLDDAVLAMKSLSAHHFRIARDALLAARVYREELEAAVASIAEAGFEVTSGPPRLVVIGADLGLCGQYHTRLVDAAVAAASALGTESVVCIGRRTASLLARAGVRSEVVYGAPTSVDNVVHVLLDVVSELILGTRTGRYGSIDAVFARFEGVGVFEPVQDRLLPLARLKGGGPPASPYVTASHLREVALRERFYVHLEERLLDAMASEHGMRLVATNSAGEWLDRELERAGHAMRALRQESATQEILELVAGARHRRAEAMRRKDAAAIKVRTARTSPPADG